MTDEPRTKKEIYESLKDSITGKITKITNFTDRSFNYIWTQAFAEEVRKLEVLAAVSELNGWIEYVGGPVTQDDLEEIGYNNVDAEEVNEIMKDEYLDEYVKLVGVTRFAGEPATGTVTIDTQSPKTEIEKGTVISTLPDSEGNTLDFQTTEYAETADGITSTVNVPIEATEVGTEYNLPANTIVRFNDPPIGVRGVTNPESTTGGKVKESNEELRERAKQAITGAAEGGTTEGIKAYIRQNVEGVGEGDVEIKEFTEPCPPFVDVIVDGGNESDVVKAIDESRPVGIKHNFVKPQVYQIGVTADVTGSNTINTTIKDELTTYLLNLGIGDDLFQDNIVKVIMNADSSVENIDYLKTTYDRVTNEGFTYNQDIDSAIAESSGVFIEQTDTANDTTLDDVTLLPESPAVGDAYYFGMNNKFKGFDITLSNAGSGTWGIVWEYYDGSSWQSLPNVTDETNDFQTGGKNTVLWDVPTDWIRTTINQREAYFVRARLNSFNSIDNDGQPLASQIRITGGRYPLDLTYDSTNGSITLIDNNKDVYAEGSDFTVVDKTGDGFPETIQWFPKEKQPEHEEQFFVDYDVTTEATSDEKEYNVNLVRDEQFVYERNRTETYTFTQNEETLEYVPFDTTVSITDENNNSYTQGTDYELISVGRGSIRSEEFTYDKNDDKYYLRFDADGTTITIFDSNGNSYNKGTDYNILDLNNDNATEVIEWDTTENTPSDGQNFTVEYRPDNSIPQTIDWDVGGSSPNGNEEYTVTYHKKMYHLEQELVETPNGEIVDSTGNVYEEGSDYEIVDYDLDSETDTVSFLTSISTLLDGKEFYITYITEGDVLVESREKVDPSTRRISIRSNNG